MKKLLLSGALLIAGLSANAQTFFGPETFDSSIPGTWTIIDVDGFTSSTSQAAWASWAHNATWGSACSSSWYDNSFTGPTNDWLITPVISVPATGTNMLTFWASSHEASYLEEYEVLISTTGTNTTDFTNTMLTIVDESDAGTDHSIDISAFNGSNIYIAFHHTSNDESMLHIDNVECATLPDDDIELLSVNISPVISAGNYSITGTVQNNGANTITSFDVDWNDGTAHNATITQTIPSGGTYNFTHPTQLTAVAGMSYTIDVCADVTNDAVAGNNCINGNTTVAATQEGTRLGLVELFTSSTCPPCFTMNQNFNLATGATSGGPGFSSTLNSDNANDESGADIAVVKFQVNWPGAGDHAYNTEVGTRVSYYGVSAAPTPILNGDDITGGNWWELTQQDYDDAKAEPAFVDISATHTITGNNITVDVTVDPYTDYSNAKLFIALLDDYYTAGGSGDNFTNGEPDFHHIFRKMLPSASGQTINLTSGNQFTDQETYTMNTVTSGFPAQGSYDFHNGSNKEVVVYIQAANGDVLNAAVSVNSGGGSGSGLDENSGLTEFMVYPNPAVDMTNVQFGLIESSNVELQVVNTLGQVVSAEILGQVEGFQNVQLNTANLENGIYFININVGGVITTQKLTINK